MSEPENPFENFIPQLKSFINAETVFGEPFQAGDVTLIPVNSVKVGFGFGNGKAKKNNGSGGGGGVVMTPVAFIVVNGTDVTIHPLNAGTLENVLEKVPSMVDKISGIFQKKATKPTEP